MSNAVLIQACKSAAGGWGDMLGLYYARHAQYCAAHDWHYWCQIGPERWFDDGEDPWWRLGMVQRALAQGYEYVCLMDADAMINDISVDLREACITPLNMVRWSFPLSHLQAGVTYWRGEMAYNLVSVLLNDRKYYLERAPGLMGWYEQGQINEMYKEKRTHHLFTELPYKFNWGTHFCRPFEEKPVVVAWHGIAEPAQRVAEMRTWLEQGELAWLSYPKP
jgi:hypothetical protein